jgi:hypothetical protein
LGGCVCDIGYLYMAKMGKRQISYTDTDSIIFDLRTRNHKPFCFIVWIVEWIASKFGYGRSSSYLFSLVFEQKSRPAILPSQLVNSRNMYADTAGCIINE